MPRRRYPREHGTRRGYHQHDTLREVPCGACLAALAREAEAVRHRGKCARGLGWPMEARRG